MRLSKRLVQTSWWEGLVVGKTGSCPGGQGHAQTNFNPIACRWRGLYSFSVSFLAWCDLALESTVSKVGLMVSSRRVHAIGHFPELLLSTLRSPRRATTHPSFAEDPPTLVGRSDSVSSVGTVLSPWDLVCTRLCVCSPIVESLFPPVL